MAPANPAAGPVLLEVLEQVGAFAVRQVGELAADGRQVAVDLVVLHGRRVHAALSDRVSSRWSMVSANLRQVFSDSRRRSRPAAFRP